MPTPEEQLTPKIYVNQAISDGVDEPTLVRLDPDDKLYEQNSIVPYYSLMLPKTVTTIPTKLYVDSRIKDPSFIRNNTHVDFNDKNFDNVRFVKVNSMPAVREHLTSKHYVDQVIFQNLDDSPLIRLDSNQRLELDEQDSVVLNSISTSPRTILELPPKSYVDSSNEIERNRRDLPSVSSDPDN